MYSRAAVHRRGVVNLAFLLYRAQQGGFVRLVIHFSRPLSLEILAESRDEKDDHTPYVSRPAIFSWHKSETVTNRWDVGARVTGVGR